MTRIVAIVGGSGSGKTTIARALAAALSSASLIAEDDYYRCRTTYAAFDPDTQNFDEPAAKDHALLIAHLAAARRGEAFAKPCYDLTTHSRSPQAETIAPREVLIVEGLHLLASDALAAAFDLKVFIEADDALRLARRLARDVRERARTPASVARQFAENVRPMHDLHVAPQRARADLVVIATAAGGAAETVAQAQEIAQRLGC